MWNLVWWLGHSVWKVSLPGKHLVSPRLLSIQSSDSWFIYVGEFAYGYQYPLFSLTREDYCCVMATWRRAEVTLYFCFLYMRGSEQKGMCTECGFRGCIHLCRLYELDRCSSLTVFVDWRGRLIVIRGEKTVSNKIFCFFFFSFCLIPSVTHCCFYLCEVCLLSWSRSHDSSGSLFHHCVPGFSGYMPALSCSADVLPQCRCGFVKAKFWTLNIIHSVFPSY